MRTRDEVQSLLQSVLGHVTDGEAQASYTHEQFLATRFGENAITQNTAGTSEEVAVEVAIGRREGRASTNRLDADALAAAVRQAETIARHAPENEEHVRLPGPQRYPDVPPRYFPDTAALPPEHVAGDVRTVIARARERGLTASGLFQVDAGASAVANSNGLFAFSRGTSISYSATAHGPAGSGKVETDQNDHRLVDIDQVSRTLVDNALAAQNPVDVAPGDYTVIFEPLAVREFLVFLMMTMSAREADEGSTAFAGTVGTRLFSDQVTFRLRTDEPALPAVPYGSAGLATRPTTWVERGEVRRLHHDRYWASRQNVEPDGSRVPLFMDGADASVADLVRGCRRGLLVKNLWYIRFVDRKALLLTGMTRDGLFLVEGGEVVGPVKNLRWNESPIVFLQNVVALSRSVRIGPWAMLPGVMSDGFTFTSTTDSL